MCTFEELDINFESFDFDFNYSSNPITICERFQFKNSIYHTQSYTRIGNKRCNFAVRFKRNNNRKVFFGLIQKFVCLNSSYYIAIKELVIRKNICDGIKGRTSDALVGLKRQGILDLYYAECQINNTIILIKYSQLVSKCIIKELENGFFLVSEYLIDNDYN